MKIKEILEKLEWALGETTENISFLYEQAAGRSDMKRICYGLGETIIDHICKILYLKNKMPETVNHWCSEIQTPLNWIIKKELKSGKLKASYLIDWLNDNLTSQAQMAKRRIDVAKSENIPVTECKPLEETDYQNVYTILKNLVEITLKHKYTDFAYISIDEIQDIISFL